MDRIAIQGLEVWARHGVLPHEREIGQRFVVDVVIELDLAPAGTSDELSDTVDYGELAQQVHDVVAGRPQQLLESVGSQVLDVCLRDGRVRAAEVVIHKPTAPLRVPADEVRVEMRRERTS